MLDCVNELFGGVAHECQVTLSHVFSFFYPSLDRIEPCLVELLRLNQLFDPVFLPLFQGLDDVLLVHQMFLVFAEILGADILDFVQLSVVLVSQVQTLSLGLGRVFFDKIRQLVVLVSHFLMHLLFQHTHVMFVLNPQFL